MTERFSRCRLTDDQQFDWHDSLTSLVYLSLYHQSYSDPTMAIIQSNPIYPDQCYRRDLINVFFRFVDGKVRWMGDGRLIISNCFLFFWICFKLWSCVALGKHHFLTPSYLLNSTFSLPRHYACMSIPSKMTSSQSRSSFWPNQTLPFYEAKICSWCGMESPWTTMISYLISR